MNPLPPTQTIARTLKQHILLSSSAVMSFGSPPYLHCNMCMFHCGGHKLLFRLLRRGISSFFCPSPHRPQESSQSRLNYPQRGGNATTTTLVCMAGKLLIMNCTARHHRRGGCTLYCVFAEEHQGQMTKMQLIWLSTRAREEE